MGTTERRQREKDEIRTKILDAARELFASEGFEAVTMRKVADKIEYSATALYLYFPDKDALIRDLCDQDFRTFAARFTAALDAADPVLQLRRSGELYMEFALTHPQHFRLMFMTPHSARESTLERGNPEQDAYALLRMLSASAIEAGRVSEGILDPDELAQLLWSATHGIASIHIAKCNAGWVELKEPRVLSERMFDAMFAGLLRVGDVEQRAAANRLAGASKVARRPAHDSKKKKGRG